MTDTPRPRPAESFAEAEDALLSRWPETRLEPSLDRIRAFVELLGDPQASYPVIHLTGTNGKTSTSRMIDTLLRALELRTGRFTCPHLERMSERICVDGEPLTDEEFVRAFNDVAPYTHLVDAARPHPLSFFETIVGDGVRRLRRRAGRRGGRRGRHGRRWDATNVADAAVAVVLPIAVDHAKYLGAAPGRDRPREGRDHQARLDRRPGRADPSTWPRCCCAGAAEVGATVRARGRRVRGALTGSPAVGGQLLLAAGPAGALRRRVPAAVRRAPGAERGRRAGRGRGVRGRPAARRRAGPRRRSPRSARPAGSR